MSVVFQMAHLVEEAEQPLPDEKGIVNNEWTIHELETTANFAKRSRILAWLIGGLNFQIEHHLFPNINHVHYPKLNPIVVATCKEFGVNYREFSSVSSAIFSHYRQLYLLGSGKTEAELSGESAVSQTVA